MIKVTIPQCEREIDRAGKGLSTELSTGSVDKETPGSELDFGGAIPTSGSLWRVPLGMAKVRLEGPIGWLEPEPTCR